MFPALAGLEGKQLVAARAIGVRTRSASEGNAGSEDGPAEEWRHISATGH